MLIIPRGILFIYGEETVSTPKSDAEFSNKFRLRLLLLRLVCFIAADRQWELSGLCKKSLTRAEENKKPKVESAQLGEDWSFWADSFFDRVGKETVYISTTIHTTGKEAFDRFSLCFFRIL